MEAPPFRVSDYVRPETIEEALAAAAAFGKKGRILAGGTNLLRDKPSGIDALIDITRLDLGAIENGDGLKIGALATVQALRTSPLLEGPYVILKEAAHAHGHALIRHLATIGGNVCDAHPVLDFPPPLLGLDALVTLRSTGGERSMPLRAFFRDFQETARTDDEILTGFEIPALPPRTGAVYLRMGWTRVDLALVNAAIVVSLAPDNICLDARIALGTAGPIPFRCAEAESVVEGREIDDACIRDAAAIASRESRPVSYARGSEAYKRHMIGVFVARGLREAARRAMEEANDA